MFNRCNAHLVRTIDHDVELLGVAVGTPGTPSPAVVVAAGNALAEDRAANRAETRQPASVSL